MVSLNWPRSGKGESEDSPLENGSILVPFSALTRITSECTIRKHVPHDDECFLGWTKVKHKNRRKIKRVLRPFLLSIVEYAVLHIDFVGFAVRTVFGKDKFLDNDCPSLEEVPETLARIGRVDGLQDFILKGRPPFKGFAVVLVKRTPQKETRG